MRTLMLAENLPYPTFKGGDLRNWQNVNALRRAGEVGVFGLCSNDRRLTRPRADLALWRPSSDPELAFPPPARRVAQARRWLLDPDGHPSDTYYSPRAALELERILEDFQADVLVVERLWLHRYIAHARSFVGHIVLDAHNIEAELSRQLAFAADDDGLPRRNMRERLAERTESIERQAIHAVDQIWVCSENDRRCVEQQYHPTVRVHVVPNGVDVDSYGAVPRPSACAPGAELLVFPAMFMYGPNAAAARFLIRELMPLMRDATRACRLVLVGSMPTAEMLDAARNDDRIVVTGTLPDVRPFLQAASAVVVPLFQGSGTRFKILEAFAARVPVITTAVGADGLDVEDGTHVLIAQTAAEFAAAVERLWSDPDLVERLTRHAHDLVRRNYSWDAACRRIADALGEFGPRDGMP
jgi:glycosyltransferase involved in cell wall biosynthesis